MRSYVKLIGPPVVDSLNALPKVAADSPVVTLDPYLPRSSSPTAFREHERPPPRLRTTTRLIARADIVIGDYDFVFEWARPPTPSKLEHLLATIDNALTPLRCFYAIETK